MEELQSRSLIGGELRQGEETHSPKKLRDEQIGPGLSVAAGLGEKACHTLLTSPAWQGTARNMSKGVQHGGKSCQEPGGWVLIALPGSLVTLGLSCALASPCHERN